MVYFDSWDEFLERSVELFRADPITVRTPFLPDPHPLCTRIDLTPPPFAQTRYVMKYRHCDGKLVLKVTDDLQVRLPLLSA